MEKDEEYQREAMCKYMQKLENHKTKIVPTPQTELDKTLKVKVVRNRKKRNKERNKALNAAKSKLKKNVCRREKNETKEILWILKKRKLIGLVLSVV